MPITLAEYEQLATDPVKKGVVNVFRRDSTILDRLSFESANSLNIEIIRTKGLPSVGWRKVGEPFAESKGSTEPIQERIHLLGGQVDVDKVYVDAGNTVQDVRAMHTEMFSSAITLAFNDAFINGRPETDVDSLIGLWYRFKNGLIPSAQHINVNGLDISPDVAAATLSANFNTLYDNIMDLIHRCDLHKADALYMNDTMYLRLVSGLRQLGLWSTAEDKTGKTVPTFGPGGPAIYDIGYKADQTTRVITNVENNAGTALTGGGATSIYAIKFGEQYLNGFELKGLNVNDLGLLNDGVTYRTVIDWQMGIYVLSPRSVARLSGIVAA